MNCAIILILISKIVKGGEDPDSPKTSEPNDRGLITKVSNTEVTVVHNDLLKEQCNNVRPLIQYDKAFCHENCIHVAEDCKLASDPVQCVAKLKNKSVERNLFFKKCKFADSFQELVDNRSNNYTSKCFLTKSVYRDSWVDTVNRSCHCALVNAEPCSEEEILNSEDTLEELRNLAICPRFDHEKFKINDKSIFSIAIAGGKKIHCPKMWMLANNSPERPNRPMKGVDLEIGSVDDSELSKFCQHGPVYSTYSGQSSSKGWHYSCDDVKAVDPKWKNSCQEMCIKVDRHCSKFDSQLIECLKQRLKKGEEQRLFTKYNCYFPEAQNLTLKSKNENLESRSSKGYLGHLHQDKRFMSHAHGHDDHHGHGDHHHEEPPHYAYRGDGLPSVKCEELQHMLHMNERLKTKLSERPEVHPSESHLETSDKVDPETMEVYTELQVLYNKVLAANWHDTVQLTMNMDIWVSNLDKLRRRGRDLPHVQVQALLSETLKLFDLVYQVEDLQDHLYELMEELTPGPDSEADHAQNAVSNLKEHLGEVLTRYQEMKRLYPEYTVKLKESIGYTLAVLRQRYTFDWPEEHSYFY
ncbi:hypothetical protein MACK_001273 [Theileria orientalis]|uniref:DUF6827 domain-containing protein n=1 Tax=Theileria orientalis TaxID=68886 RepID=A0A976MEA6_THEOR|nr:hypothetical protein MACK_001273 [Theileria orientalis]